MSFRNVGIVYRKELTEALRDRRTLISTLLVPLVLFPILTAGLGAAIAALVGKAKEEVPEVMILDGSDSPQIIAGLKSLDKIKVVPTAANWKDQIANKEVRAAVEIPPDFEKDLEQQKPSTVKIYIYEGEIKSGFARDRVQEYLKDYRDTIVKQRLVAKNLPESTLTPF
ncbi:MAG TPA: ABC transporter permease, partial [Candidatus Acidoferrum sp.]